MRGSGPGILTAQDAHTIAACDTMRVQRLRESRTHRFKVAICDGFAVQLKYRMLVSGLRETLLRHVQPFWKGPSELFAHLVIAEGRFQHITSLAAPMEQRRVALCQICWLGRFQAHRPKVCR